MQELWEGAQSCKVAGGMSVGMSAIMVSMDRSDLFEWEKFVEELSSDVTL